MIEPWSNYTEESFLLIKLSNTSTINLWFQKCNAILNNAQYLTHLVRECGLKALKEASEIGLVLKFTKVQNIPFLGC